MPFDSLQDSELDTILERVVRGLEQSATPDRADRLFPADPSMCNPLGVAHGALGVLYAFHLITGQVDTRLRNWVLRKEIRPDAYIPSLYHGMAGIAWIFVEIGLGDEADRVIKQADHHPLLYSDLGIEYGCSGYGLANLFLWHKTGNDKYKQTAVDVGRYLIEVGRANDGLLWPRSGPRILGYARGQSGPALFFLYLYLATREEQFLDFGCNLLKAELHCAASQPGGYLSIPEEAGTDAFTPYWQRGTAGVLTALVRYAKVTTDPFLMAYMEKLLPDVRRKYTLFPGLFNGLAGLGNILLDVYQLFGDQTCLEDAHAVARGISLYVVPRDDAYLIPGDWLYRCSSDYATGAAGVALFLWRLRNNAHNFNLLLDGLLMPST